MRIECLRDLEKYLDKTQFPGSDLILRIRNQFGDISLSESAKEIACGGGLVDKEARQRFYGLAVTGRGKPDSHFSGKEKSVLEECARRFDHHYH